MGHRIAGIAPIGGYVHRGYFRQPALPIPLLDLHGYSDDACPANISEANPQVRPGVLESGGGPPFEGWYFYTLDSVFDFWMTSNQCKNTSHEAHWPTPFDGQEDF